MGCTEERAADHAIWRTVERIVDRVADVDRLRAHGLRVFAARRWRAQGRPVPDEVAQAEVASTMAALAAPILLRRVLDAYDEPVLLVKGPEVASYYPDPVLRPYADIDVIAKRPAEAQRALRAAGFVEADTAAALEPDHHHLRPLAWPGLMLRAEIHRQPNWPKRMSAPPPEALFEVAVASRTSPRVLTLPPTYHALLLAAHSWAHAPLASLRDMIDVAVLAHRASDAEVETVARDWGLSKIWRATRDAMRSLFGSEEPSLAMCVWARNLPAVRERTVFESHLENWISPFWALPPLEAARAMVAALTAELTPADDEAWAAKLTRSRHAVAHAFIRKSAHDAFVAAAERKRKARRNGWL